jgi:hypothetical protein
MKCLDILNFRTFAVVKKIAMIRNSRSHIFFSLFFQALAVAIISVGSLINFHQYKIWDKPLIPQFVGIKREADDHSGFFTASNPSQNSCLNDFSFSGPACLFSGSEFATPCSHCGVLASGHPGWLPKPAFLNNIGLRAPPVA